MTPHSIIQNQCPTNDKQKSTIQRQYIHFFKNKVFLYIFLIVCFSISLLAVVRPPLLQSPKDIYKIKSSTNVKNINPIDDTKKKNQSQVPVVWSGAILEQEEKKIGGFLVTVITLKGGAWVKHKNVTLSANEIEIIGRDVLRATLKGKVVVDDPENKTQLTSLGAVYDKFTETILLDGNPRIYYIDKDKKRTKISAPYIKRFIAESKTIIEKGVIIENEDYTILTENAILYENEKTLVMDNYPYIFGKKMVAVGEKLVYKTETNNASLENNSIVFRISEEKVNKKTDPSTSNESSTNSSANNSEEDKIELKEVLNVFKGDKLIYQTGKEEDRYIGMYGNAEMVRMDSTFKADYIRAYGKDNKNIEAKNNIRYHDIENDTIIYGNLLEHFQEENYTHITEEPKMEFLDKKTKEVKSTLKSVEIERFIDRKEMVARGNVSITGQDTNAYSQYATFYEGDEKIILEGNPKIEREGKLVRSGKILMYPKENRAILTDGIFLEKKVE